MAFGTFGTVASVINGTSQSSVTITSPSGINPANRHFAVLTLSMDNLNGGVGDFNEVLSVTGGNGTWYKIGEHTNGEGAAGAGVTVGAWLFRPNAPNAGGTTFTVTFDGAVVDKCIALAVATYGVGLDVSIDPTFPFTVDQSSGAAGYPSLSVSGVPNKYRNILRVSGKEVNVLSLPTPSSGWTTLVGLRSRNNAAAIRLDGEYIRTTSTGGTSSFTAAFVGDTADIMFALHEEAPAPPADQDVLPPLLTQSKTLYAPTVTQPSGSQDVAPPLLTRGKTLYAPTVSAGAVTVLTPLLTRAKTLYAPSVTTGAVSILPPLLTRTKTLYAPTVTNGAVTVLPPLLTRVKTLYAPTVAVGAVSLAAPLLTNSKTLFAPIVTQGGVVLQPPLLVRSKALFAPTVSAGSVTLSPPLLTNVKVLYAPVVSQAGGEQFILPPPLVRDKVLFPPSVAHKVNPPNPSLGGGGGFGFGRDKVYRIDKPKKKEPEQEERKDKRQPVKAKASTPISVTLTVPTQVVPLYSPERLASLERSVSELSAQLEAERIATEQMWDEEAVLLLLAS